MTLQDYLLTGGDTNKSDINGSKHYIGHTHGTMARVTIPTITVNGAPK